MEHGRDIAKVMPAKVPAVQVPAQLCAKTGRFSRALDVGPGGIHPAWSSVVPIELEAHLRSARAGEMQTLGAERWMESIEVLSFWPFIVA